MAFKGDIALELAAQFQELAHGMTTPLMIGHLLRGISLVLVGDITRGRLHLDQAIALYDPVEHRSLATRFGHDVRASALAWRALALCMLGYSEAARADVEHAVKDSREIGHAATSMFVLSHTSLALIFCGSDAATGARVDELVELAAGKGAHYWKSYGMLLQGWLLARRGKAADAVSLTRAGITAMRSTGATAYAPWYLSFLARACAELGQFEDAGRCIGEAMTALETTKEKWCEADIHRIAGEIALMAPAPDAAKAQTCFERALSVAREQQAKSPELRSAMRLARLWRDQRKQQQARDLLAPICAWFADGSDTPELTEAKALLESLAS